VLQAGQRLRLDRLVPLAREADVDAVVIRRPGQRLQLGQQLGRLPALGQPQVEQEEAGRQAVALGDVHAEPEPARLLSADDGVGLRHLGSDVLEADPGLVCPGAVDLRQARGHGGGRDGIDGWTDGAAHVEQVPVQQAVDLELVDEYPFLGGHAHPIGITIEGDTDVRAPARDLLQPLVHVGADRFRVEAAEVGIALGVELAHGEPPVPQQPSEPAGARPVQRLDQHTLVGRPDAIQVDDALQLVAEARVGVELLDQAGGNRLAVGAAWGQLVLRVLVHGGLDGGQHLGRGRPTGVGLDLEAVVGPWVVAGGDDDAGPRVQLPREEAAHLGGHRLGRDEGADVLRGQNLDAGTREVLGGEAAVVADDHPTVGGARLLEVLGHPTRAAPHVVEGVVLGDGRAPAIGPELDLGHAKVGTP
jgi:hypothetical protein